MRQCMWGPLTRMRIHNEEFGCPSFDERDPYGPICMQCSECWRPSGYDYIAQMLRSKVDGVLLDRHSHIIDRVAEYCWMSCALYARWVEIYEMALEFQDEPPDFIPCTPANTPRYPQRTVLTIGALPAFDASVHMPKHVEFLARTPPAIRQQEDLERRAREQRFLEECPEAYGLDWSNLVEDPDGRLRLQVMAPPRKAPPRKASPPVKAPPPCFKKAPPPAPRKAYPPVVKAPPPWVQPAMPWPADRTPPRKAPPPKKAPAPVPAQLPPTTLLTIHEARPFGYVQQASSATYFDLTLSDSM